MNYPETNKWVDPDEMAELLAANPAGRNKASGSDVALPESEASFMSWVIDLLKLKGYRVAHFRPGMTSRKDRYGKPVWVTPMIGDPGFPDIVAAKQGFPVLFIELKTDKAHLTRGQKDWLDTLDSGWMAKYSHMACVWRPCHRAVIEKLLED